MKNWPKHATAAPPVAMRCEVVDHKDRGYVVLGAQTRDGWAALMPPADSITAGFKFIGAGIRAAMLNLRARMERAFSRAPGAGDGNNEAKRAQARGRR